MIISYETIKFFKNKKGVSGLLLKYYKFSIPHEQLISIGDYDVSDGKLIINCSEKKATRVQNIISNALNNLECTITKNPAVYIDKTSKIPLIGALEFGIIDRGTNLIEIRPCSGCNLSCIYCSVHEGPKGPKKKDFVIEPDYLLEWFDKVACIKTKPIEVFIETMGEPLLYSELEYVIAKLKERSDVKQVTMVTNGTFLSEERIHNLKKAGLDRINWSINSLDEETAKKIADGPYNLKRIKELIEYSSKHIDTLLCPVIMRGVNDHELESFVQYAISIRDKEPVIGFQNFLEYKMGRNPVKEMPMTEFNKKIMALEKKYNKRLIVSADDFQIEKDNSLPRPFRKKDYVSVRRLFGGRQKNETFVQADDRVIKVIGRVPDKNEFKVQIIRDKHNIFLAKTA